MTADTIPVHERIVALEERRLHLEVRLQHCVLTVANSPGLNLSIGRELDDARAALASDRAELQRLSPSR